jgi:hypothetical protein
MNPIGSVREQISGENISTQEEEASECWRPLHNEKHNNMQALVNILKQTE